MNKNSIYILLSQTQTKFAKAIRKIGKQEYNHAAISLDESFSEVYSYARPQHNAVFLGGLVKESLARYTLLSDDSVPVAAFKIPVSDSEYIKIKETIKKMENNPDYMYNLFSVLSYPLTKGISVSNTFTCVEFVVYIMQNMGYLTDKQSCRYKPDELAEQLDKYCVYKGDIRGCLPNTDDGASYFAPFTVKLFYKSVKAFLKLVKRTSFCLVKRI